LVVVVRAWPDRPPPGRPHIIDGWPRVTVDDYDYRGLLSLLQNVIVLDWDVAVDLDDLRRFAGHAAAQPGRPLFGPYKLWGEPVMRWCALRYTEPEKSAKSAMRWVEEGEPSCHRFGFGFTYLPFELMAAFTEAHPGHIMSDVDFASWHYDKITPEVEIDWSVRGVHVHYDVPPGGRL
jgi:hypothetical protein